MDRTPTSARLGGDHHAPSLFHAACSGAFLDVGGAPLDLALDIHHALAAHVCTVMLRVLLGACGRDGDGKGSTSITPFRKCAVRAKVCAVFAHFREIYV